MINIELLENFRENLCNEVYDYLINNHKLKEYNIICSSIDWMTVAIEIQLGIKLENDNWRYFPDYKEVLLFIMTSDQIISNSINILNIFSLYNPTYNNFRKFRETNKDIITHLFSDKDLNDYLIFKKIRAIFCAHNTDIRGSSGNVFCNGWAYNETKYDNAWACLLYSNKEINGCDQFEIFLFLDELKKYVEICFLELEAKISAISCICLYDDKKPNSILRREE